MGGGFGGGAAFGAFGTDQSAIPSAAADPSKANLLQGLQDTRRRMRGRQIDKLNRMYLEGMGGGGMNAGGAF
jgi:hypothetical protein